MSADLYGEKAAHFYDAFHATYAADLNFYVKQAKKQAGPVLELACGSGRVGIELIKAGIDYLGLDAAEGMLALFRSKWSSLGRSGEAPVRAGDMRDFELQKLFGLIAITHNSLQHIYRDEDVLKVFARCKAHLQPEGRLIFDVFNPDRAYLDRDPEKRYHVTRFFDEKRDDWCEVDETYRYIPATKVSHIHWFYRYEKGDSGTFRLEMRQFFPQEIDALIGEAGLRIRHKWGDFVGSGFSAASPRQVFECTL